MFVDTVVTQVNTKKFDCKPRWKKGDPFLDIPLDPAVPKTLKGTFQETLYLQQLQSGKPAYHRLRKNDATGKLHPTASVWQVVSDPHASVMIKQTV